MFVIIWGEFRLTRMVRESQEAARMRKMNWEGRKCLFNEYVSRVTKEEQR